MNKLEIFQQEKQNGLKSIKSYPILNQCFTPPTKQLIELIISYQENNQQLTMKYKTISELLNVKYQTVKDMVTKYKKLGIIITDHKSNYNGVAGGSRSALAIDMDKLISYIKANTADLNKDKPESIQTLIEPENDSLDEVFTTPFYTAPVELEIKENINSEYEIDEIIDYRDTTEKFNIVDIIKPYMYDNDIFNDDKFNQCDVIVDEFKKIIDTSSFCFTLKQIKNCGEYLNGKLEFGTQEQLEQIINLINNFQPPVAA